MTLIKVPIAPGIDQQDTEYGAEGRWFFGKNVRFRYGLPEKIGGFITVTTDALIGAARGIVDWFDTRGEQYLATGTNKKLYVYQNNAWYDITPTRDSGTGNITGWITVINSPTVTVTDASHGAIEGDFVTIPSVSGAVNGIPAATLQNKQYEIIEVVSTSQYKITATANATSSGASSTTANAAYEINTNPATSIAGYGWGAGTWGLSTWGTTRAGLAAPNSVQLDSGKWSLDTWGEDLLACQFNGSLYYWDTSASYGTPVAATIIANAPTQNRFVLVSGTDRHVICFGTQLIGTTTQDEMFIRWSDQEDHTSWTPTSTNTSGSQRLTDGSKLITAKRSRGAVLVWTDTALYQMQLVGAPFTFGFSQLGSACGAIGLHSAVESNGNSFWMGKDSFFVFDGSVKKIPCSVEDYVFENIDQASQKDTFACLNSEFNEVTWFYPSSGSQQIDRYVTYNYQEQTWSIGDLARSSWVDKGVYDFPYALDYNSTSSTTPITPLSPATEISGVTNGRALMYAQENGTDANGAALESELNSGAFVIPEAGERLMAIKRFIPDFKNISGNVNVDLIFKLYPTSSSTTIASTVTPTTTKVDTRARGRQAQISIKTTGVGDNWRYGTYRADVQQDGMR